VEVTVCGCRTPLPFGPGERRGNHMKLARWLMAALVILVLALLAYSANAAPQ